MSELYRKGRSSHLKTSKQLRRRLIVFSLIAIAVVVATSIVIYDLSFRQHDSSPQVSKTTVEQIRFDGQFHKSDFFQFADDGNWQMAKSESTDNKIIYRKFLGKSDLVQHQLVVYINNEPPQQELAVTRVLPVELKNNNSFIPKEVSARCGEQYGASELKKVKIVNISQTQILCDPDLSRYRVVFGEVGGDYRLKLKRADGTYASYIIYYQDSRINPGSEVLNQLAETFMAL